MTHWELKDNNEKMFMLYWSKLDLTNLKTIINKNIRKELIIICIKNILKDSPLDFMNMKILEIMWDKINKYELIYLDKPLIFYFIEKRDYISIELLLKKNIKINIKYNKKSIWDYYFSDKKEDFNILNLLLSYGVDLNILDKNNNTPLILSVIHNYIYSFELILKNSIDLINFQNKKGNSVIHYVCIFNNYYAFKILFNYKIDIKLKNKNKKMPVDWTKNIRIKKMCNKYKSDNKKKQILYLYKNMFKNNSNFNHSSNFSDSKEEILSMNSWFYNKPKHKRSVSFDFELIEQKNTINNSNKLTDNIKLDNEKDRIYKKNILITQLKPLKSKLDFINKKYYNCLLKNKVYNLNYLRVFRFKFNSLDNIEYRFNTEVLYFNNYIDKYNKFQITMDIKLIDKIKEVINSYCKNIIIEIFGSFETKLNLPFSDIDICLKNFKGDTNSLLINLQNKFLEINFKAQCILTANVPVLKLQSCKKYNFRNIDISWFSQDFKGFECVKLINKYLNEYKMLSNCIRILKEILRNSDINNTFTGGLSSYSIVLIVMSFVQYFKYLNKIDFNQSYFNFFCKFFKFFINLDYNKKYLKPMMDKDFNYNPIKNKTSYNNNLTIIDPLNSNNNVSKSSFNIEFIKYVFSTKLLKWTQIDDYCLESSIIFDKIKNTRYKYKFENNNHFQINIQYLIFLKKILFK